MTYYLKEEQPSPRGGLSDRLMHEMRMRHGCLVCGDAHPGLVCPDCYTCRRCGRGCDGCWHLRKRATRG